MRRQRKPVPRKPRSWKGSLGSVSCEAVADHWFTGQQRFYPCVHIEIGRCVMDRQECLRMAKWMQRAADWIGSAKEGER